MSAWILARRPLKWLDKVRDLPIAVRAETGRSADDLRIELQGISDVIEGQAKQGLTGLARVCEALDPILADSLHEPHEHGVLIVDPNASRDVKTRLMRDLQRLREGRSDLESFSQQVVDHIHTRRAAAMLPRLYVVALALLERHDGHREAAISRLEAWLGDPEAAERAWTALVANAHYLIRSRGRSDRDRLEQCLVEAGIALPPASQASPASLGLSPSMVAGLPLVSSAMPVSSEAVSVADRTHDGTWHAQIDLAGGMLQRREPQRALPLLAQIEQALSLATAGAHPPVNPAALQRRILGNRANALAQVGRLDEAATAIDSALRTNAADPTLTLIAARVAALDARVPDAIAHAERVLAHDPTNADAWALLVELGVAVLPLPREEVDGSTASGWQPGETVLATRTPPVALWMRPSLLRAAGLRAMHADRVGDAATFLRASADLGGREPEALVLLASLRLRFVETGAAAPGLGAPAPAHAREAEQLTTDALDQLGDLTFSLFAEQALLMRAHARRILRNLDAALADTQLALAVHPESSPERWRPVYLTAALLIDNHRGVEADQLLEQFGRPEHRALPREVQVAFLLLRARRKATLGDRAAVESLIADVLTLVDQETVAHGTDVRSRDHARAAVEARAVAFESAIDVGALELAAALLEALPEAQIGWPSYLLAARLRLARGEHEAAWQAFYAAADGARAADEDAAQRVQLEHAFARQEAGDNAAAMVLFDQARAWERHPLARARVIAFLLDVHEEGRAQLLLEELRREGPLPPWALSATAAIAEAANDLEGARTALEELWRTRPDNVVTGLRLATAYGRLNDHDKALPVLKALAARDGLSGAERMHLATRLTLVGDVEEALRQAFHAVRLASDDSEIASAYLQVMLRHEQSGAVLSRHRVAPDSVVRLVPTRRGGRTDEAITYTVLTAGPVDSRRLEFLATDSRIAVLLHRKVGDVVTLRRGQPTEASYRVDSIEHAYVAAAQEIVRSFPERFPESRAIQRFSLDENSTVANLMPMVAEVHRQAAQTEQVLEVYDENPVPLEVVARALGRDVPNVCEILAARSRRFWTEWGDASRREAAHEALGRGIFVVTRSGLWTAQQLGVNGVPLLDIAIGLGRTFLAPQSLLDALDQEYRALAQWRGKEQTFLGAGPAGIATQRRSAEEVERRLREIADTDAWVRAHAQIQPRSLGALTARGAERRTMFGDASADARELALGDTGALWTDDLGLRLAEEDGSVPAGFSSAVLVEHALRHGRLSDQQYADAITHLLGLSHYFISLNDSVLFAILRANAFQSTPVVERVLNCVTDASVSIDSAIGVVARLLRRLALEPAAALAIRPIAAACITRLVDGRRRATTMALLDGALQAQLALLPLALDAIRGVMRRVLSGGDDGP